MNWIAILIIAFAIFLIVCENLAHDCAPGRKCTHSTEPPIESDNIRTYIRKIRNMVNGNYKFVIWRQALILGIIVPIPIIYFLKKRFPTFSEWLIVGAIIFVAAYFSTVWMWSHFLYPNSASIERSLLELEKKYESANIPLDESLNRVVVQNQ